MRHGQFADYNNEQVSWKTLKQLVPFLAEFRWRVLAALVFLIAAKVASVGVPYVFGITVDQLNLSSEQAVVVLPLTLILMYGALRLSTVLFGEFRDLLFGRVTERAMRRIGLAVFKHLHSLDIDFHLSRRTGGVARDIERGVSGINFLLRFMVFNIVPVFLEILFVVLIFQAKFSTNFVLIILGCIVAYIIWTAKATEWRTSYIRKANEADSKSNTTAVDSLLNYETVKYFNNEAFEERRYDHELAEWESARRSNRLSLFALNGGQALIVAVAMTSMLVLAGHMVVSETLSLGQFTMINGYIMQIFMPLNFFGFVYREMKGSMANIEKMFALLREQPKIVDQNNADELQVNQGSIQFNNVNFSYHTDRSILNNLNFSIAAGSKVAFVGSSGAGKSTLSKLLYRFYDPDSGEITIDGQDIKQVTQDSLRRAIGIVPQDTVLFNTTIGENIRYGAPNASDEDIDKAVENAYLSEFIRQLPDGLNTLVGERGLKLSGGEKQRVAIARTILKKSPILIFDEATSSLDSEAEQNIMRAIKQVAQNHTSIMIAHRLSTIVDADTIFVLHKGEIIEQGDHLSLLKADGHYAKLWNNQQQNSHE
ncbi:ABCB family ABC transporter ATP-binding protein/permease [Pleionea litopenaei]|uniref:ABC transporter ATP-binding protein/permease n=1 Tax=Pleionea litopenaei TaxID=3070815 RepID=A0AA51RQR3_9GAMM|nr:ABC transporter ATP-binding protein/permease [Pleionea sp. HL-JVS1]WMS85729.1 ABC transporter ATP-binding protein/permease [Pleionea sp. HL-JVS1]